MTVGPRPWTDDEVHAVMCWAQNLGHRCPHAAMKPDVLSAEIQRMRWLLSTRGIHRAD